MTRRSFVRNAGLAVTGLALHAPLVGCGNDSFPIPCLGPAAAPDPVPGMTYLWASKIGCALDCNLENGSNKFTGGHATDDAPRINEAMAAATADHPITLIIDGGALISGLCLPAGGHWAIAGLGCGTGFFVKHGANSDGIHNGPPSAGDPFDPGPPAPPRGKNVSLSNFTLNGNRHGDSTTADVRGTKTKWFVGINLMNLDHITMKNVVVVNTPAYHVRFSNAGYVAVSGCVMHSHGPNTDGLHFDGPANDITIVDCDFQTDDDSIALNCPEGYSGDISRVIVTGCTFNSWSLMRLYTTNGSSGQFKIETVSVQNCTGTFAEIAFCIGLGCGSAPEAINSVTISDCKLTGPGVLGISENFGSITLQNVTYIPRSSHVEPNPFHPCALLRTTPYFDSAGFNGSSLALENCSIYRDSDAKVAATVIDNSSSIGYLRFNGFLVVDAATQSPVPILVQIESGSVGQFVVDSVTTSNIAVPASKAGFAAIAAVCGVGVLATGWEFPDAVMADNVPYISATTGLPSIKIDGLIEPYVPS